MSALPDIHKLDDKDAFGKRIGILTAIIAVFLSMATISAHRAHTETIVLQNEANSSWAHYQSKRIRSYQLEMNLDLISLLAPSNPKTNKIISNYKARDAQYIKDLETINVEAEEAFKKSESNQRKALYFDFAEGVFEISLIMNSLYFVSRKKLFPYFGAVFSCIGIIASIIAFAM